MQFSLFQFCWLRKTQYIGMILEPPDSVCLAQKEHLVQDLGFLMPPVTVVTWLYEDSWRHSQHTILISCEFKLATWSWLQTRNSSLCAEVSYSVPIGTLYLRHEEAETATFWKSPAWVPQRDVLYQNALLYVLRSLCFHFSSLPLPPALPSVP